MFRLTEDKNQIICVEAYEDVPSGANIPRGHRWWKSYERWLDEGNTAIPVPVPSAEELLQQKREGMVVSKFQAKAALKQAGLLNQVQAHIATLPEDDLTRIAWEDAQEFRRLSPTIDAVTTTLNLSDTQVDDLFEQAKYIEA